MSTEKVTTGILGAGQPNIATQHQLPASLKSERVRVVALCDRLEGVKEYAASCGAKAYQDYSEMLADPEIQMIQVATPDQFHFEHARMALEASKHVLLQKPPCVNRQEMEALLKLAQETGLHCKVLLNQRHTLLSRSIRHYVENGTIGELREIIIRYRGHRFPVENPRSFYLTEASGGVWLHNSMHWLDEAVSYADEAVPAKVMIQCTKNSHGDWKVLGETPNYFSAIFPMGRVSFLFEYNTMLTEEGLPGGMQRILVGTKGEIRQNYGEGDLVLYQLGQDGPSRLPLLPCDGDAVIESFRLAIDEFADEIQNGVSHAPAFEDSMRLFGFLLQGLGR